MTTRNASKVRTMRRILPVTCAAALAAAFAAALPRAAHADGLATPLVPASIRVPAGTTPFLEGHAVGTQNYICLPAASGFTWALFAPQATLLADDDQQITTHYFSANPLENGELRATWQHSQDTSTVWAKVIAPSSDPAFVAPGAIPWLLLQVVNRQEGPTGGRMLARTTFIQRLKTAGGIAPSTGCAQSADVGKKALVPYKADYLFYSTAETYSDHAN